MLGLSTTDVGGSMFGADALLFMILLIIFHVPDNVLLLLLAENKTMWTKIVCLTKTITVATRIKHRWQRAWVRDVV